MVAQAMHKARDGFSMAMCLFTLLRHIFSVKYVILYIFFYVQCSMFFEVFEVIDHHHLFSKFSSFCPVGYHFDLFQHEFDASVFSRFENMNHHGKNMCANGSLKLPFHHLALGDRLIKPIQLVGVYKFWVVGFKYVCNVDPYLGKISNLTRLYNIFQMG